VICMNQSAFLCGHNRLIGIDKHRMRRSQQEREERELGWHPSEFRPRHAPQTRALRIVCESLVATV
jgi:hypothetical protein